MKDFSKQQSVYTAVTSQSNQSIRNEGPAVHQVMKNISNRAGRADNAAMAPPGSSGSSNAVKQASAEMATGSTSINKASNVISEASKKIKRDTEAANKALKLFGDFVGKTGTSLLSAATKFSKFSKEQKLAFQNLTGLDPTNAISGVKDINDSIEILQNSLFVGLTPVIEMVAGLFDDFAGAAGAVSRILVENETAVKIVASVVGGLVSAVIAYNTVMGIAETVTTALNIAMSLNPVGAVIAGFVAVGAAVYLLWKNFKGFREGVMGVWEVIKNVFSNIWKIVTDYVGGIVKVFSGLWKVLSNPLNAQEGIDEVVSGVKGTVSAAGSFATGGAFKGTEKAYATGVQERDAFEKAEEAEKAKKAPKKAAYDLAFHGNNKNDDESPMPSASAVQTPSKSITITINKLVERMEIHSATIKEGAGQVEDMITQALIAAVNDFQKTAGI